MGDTEAFLEWLQTQGLTDAAQVNAYRKYVEELGRHPSLSAALIAAKEAGTSEREIANLRRVAARMVEFETARNAPEPASTVAPAAAAIAGSSVAAAVSSLEVEPRRPVTPSTSPLEVEPRRPVTPSTSPDVEPRAAARPARPSAAEALLRDAAQRRRGCIRNRPYDVYLDDDFGALARMFGGGIGIGTFILIRLVGLLGALTLALGLAGMGGLVTIVSICMRCEGCRRRVGDLDDDERARVRKGRARVVLVTAGLIVGAAVCGIAWWSIVKSAHQQQY